MFQGSDTEALKRQYDTWLERLKEHDNPWSIIPYDLSATKAASMERNAVISLWNNYFKKLESNATAHKIHVYIHTPFCKSKCHFCSCKSTALCPEDNLEEYVSFLLDEARTFGGLTHNYPVSSFHFGGGTPTVYPDELFDRLLGGVIKPFHVLTGSYICCEMNPFTTTRQKIASAAKHGVNRVSFGVQTLTPDVLERVNRGYQSTDVVENAIRWAKEAGIPSINTDLLAFLDGETQEGLSSSARRLAQMGPDTIILYRFFSNCERTRFNDSSWHRAVDSFFESLDDLAFGQRSANIYRATASRRGFVEPRNYSDGGPYSGQPRSVIGIGAFSKSHIQNSAFYETHYSRENVSYFGYETDPETEARLSLALNCLSKISINREQFKQTFGERPEKFFPGILRTLQDIGVLHVNHDTLDWNMSNDLTCIAAATLFFSEDELLQFPDPIKNEQDGSQEKIEMRGSLKQLAQLIGIPTIAQSDGPTLQAAVFLYDAIELSFLNGNHDIVICIQARDGKPSFASTDHLRLSMKGDVVTPFAADLMTILVFKLKGITFETLTTYFRKRDRNE